MYFWLRRLFALIALYVQQLNCNQYLNNNWMQAIKLHLLFPHPQDDDYYSHHSMSMFNWAFGVHSRVLLHAQTLARWGVEYLIAVKHLPDKCLDDNHKHGSSLALLIVLANVCIELPLKCADYKTAALLQWLSAIQDNKTGLIRVEEAEISKVSQQDGKLSQAFELTLYANGIRLSLQIIMHFWMGEIKINHVQISELNEII